MQGDMKLELRSWQTAADVFDSVANNAPRRVTEIVQHTTSAEACGAAGGLATVDGAVAIMLTVFGSVMNEQYIPQLTQGLSSESQALLSTRQVLVDMEESAEQQASQVLGGDEL